MNHDRTFNGGMVISTAQKKFGNSSWLFDGSNDYVSIPDSADFSFGSADFTVECWVRTSTSGRTVLGQREDNSAVNQSWYYLLGGDGKLTFTVVSGVTQTSVTSSSAITDSNWHHVAAVRDGTNLRLFVDGVQQQLVTGYSSTLNDSSRDPLIGAAYAEGGGSKTELYSGYIDEIRISKGIARWTANFTPPDQPYVADPSTVLLCHCEGDMLGIGAHDLTTVGTPKMATTVPNSNYGGSLYFDGASYVNTASSPDFIFGTDDFTIDSWFYCAGNLNTTYTLIDKGYYQGGVSGNWSLALETQGSYWLLHFDTYDGTGGEQNVHGSTHVLQNTWYHVAVVRSGTNVKVYLNGVQDGSGTISRSLSGGTNNLFVGNSATGQYFLGNIAGLRVSKGLARWTSNFTPPSSPYSKPIGGVDGYTKLMLHMDGGNNSAIFTDSSLTPKTVTVNGVVQKNDKMMFGRSCGYFGASDKYLQLADLDDFDLGTGKFTIEFWFNASPTTSFPSIVATLGGWSSGSFAFRHSNGGNSRVGIYWNPLGDPFMSSTNTFANDVWHHAALTRDGSTCKLYVNGTLEATGNCGSTPLDLAYGGGLLIGKSGWDGNNGNYTGYIDELRISKGIVRYDTNFTPPTKPYDTPAVDGYTKLLLHMNGTNGGTRFPDAGVGGKVITPQGTAQTSTTTYKFGGSSLLLNGTSDYLNVPNNPTDADWNLGSNDFTIDGWFLTTNASTYQFILGGYNNGDLILAIQSGNLWIGRHMVNLDTQVAHGLVANKWYHIAISREAGIIYMFVNGTILSGTPVANTNSYAITSASWYIGAWSGANFWSGNMQELRISKGIARWTANFAPPVRPYGS